MPCPVGPAATLVAACASLNERMHDACSPVGGEPSVGARDCATADPPKRKSDDSDRESPGKAPRLGGPEALASDLHRKLLFDAASVLSLFDLLPKADITRLSQAKGSVFAVGSYSHGPIKGLRHFTRIYPNVCRYLCACVLHVLPTHKFSSLLISDSVESQPHADPNNGPTLNLLIPLTHFSGGSLRAGDCDLDFSRGAWAFNARDGCHAVAPFQGRRVMLIAFSTKGVCDSDSEVLSQLQSCGFALPSADAVMPASPVGPLPDIRSSVTHEPLKVLKPSRLVVLDLFCGRGAVGHARTTIHLAIFAIGLTVCGQPITRLGNDRRSVTLCLRALGLDAHSAFVLGKVYAEHLAESLRLQAAGEDLLPIMPEFKYMVNVHVADCSQLQLDDKNTPATATFGVFRTPDEFVAASLRLEHPFDAFAHVPDGLIRNLGRLLIDGFRCRVYSKKSWLSGPYSYQELTEILGPHWIPVRRFAIFQRGKLRCIDDLSENSVNSSWEVAEKIDLRAMDELLWITSRLMQSIVDRGFVNLRLSSGEVISGPLHTVWRTRPESARPVLKCVDLKSAYKQYAIRPCDSKRCVVSLRRPSDGQAVGFISHTLPFGSLASVGQFNRVARLIHRILIELECLACNYYDDFPVLDVSMLSANTEKTIRKLMRLLGVICSEDKELPFSSVADLLGVRLDLRAKDFSCVTVANKPDRAREISESVAKVLSDGQVVVREADSLFGRIQYADSQIMGRRGKLALSTLRKLSRGSGVHLLSSTDREAFAVLQMRMDAGEPRRIQVGSSGPSLVVYTDGACEPGAARSLCAVGGVLYASWNGAVKVRYFGVTLSDSLVDLWAESGKKHLIGLVELYALVLARFVWGRLLDDRRVLYFIDHVGVLSATINCTSRDELWRTLLIHLEKADARPCIGWYARVPSQSNPADPPSRGCWIFPMCEHAIRDHPACFATGELLRSS
ncbi:unnamed protein product [Symbiodinium sp. CCMP2592]|nr:unnamed protein product [Symbiodinium sp. CCMP2592]